MVDVIYNKAVDNVKRVSIVDRTRTSDFDGCRTTWGAAVLDDIHTRSLTLQSLQGRRYRHIVDIFARYGRDRTGYVALALHTVTDYNHLVEHG